jgi:hypothetical protein
MKEKIKSIIANLKSVARKENDILVKIDSDEISKNVYKIDIDIKNVKMFTVEKIIKMAKKYKEYKSHEFVSKLQTAEEIKAKADKNKLRFIFKDKAANESLLMSFERFNSK